ncbi:MAG: tungstate ABC transporter substrate-binding protein WtpA [Candidatus Latescibacterota bacterium]|nr:MAG: tungstate ABC transporter substrate-binding protein WtpA [Candidatus Latescibacterota bacterium]
MAAAAMVVGAGCAENKQADKEMKELIILHAGSLSVPFRDVSRAFNELYPNVTIKAEAAGSRDTARKVSDLGRSCDVLGSADYVVIDNLLIPDHAAYSIQFATNEMIIAYTDRSTHADRIDSHNWPEVLLSEGVLVGRSDPNRDPCGYRTVMVFQLSERHYKTPGLEEKLTERAGPKYIRPKETDLLALLESGEIDYLFIYRSVAEQHGLRIVTLPDEVNLKSTAFADHYGQATIEVTGKRPGEMITRTGAPMVYGVTIPHNCENRDLAKAWVELLLSETGRAIMERNGQPAVAPARTAQFDRLPERLKPYCTKAGDDG